MAKGVTLGGPMRRQRLVQAYYEDRKIERLKTMSLVQAGFSNDDDIQQTLMDLNDALFPQAEGLDDEAKKEKLKEHVKNFGGVHPDGTVDPDAGLGPDDLKDYSS